MSKIRYASEPLGSPADKELMSRRDFQRSLVNDRRISGDKNIYFLDGSEILGDDYDECTVDGTHPTDLGSARIADALQVVIEDILAK